MPERRLASRGAFLAGGLSAGLAVVYLLIIVGQGEGIPSRSWFVAGWMVGSGAMSLVSAFTRTPIRRSLLAGIGACMLVPLAVAALFSIGLLLLVPAAVGGGA